MASITFGCDEKGEHQICDRKEVLHEVEVFLSKMWNNCQSCGNCKNCRNYSFVIKELEGVGFGKKDEGRFWRVYKNTNKHGFEIVKHN